MLQGIVVVLLIGIIAAGRYLSTYQPIQLGELSGFDGAGRRVDQFGDGPDTASFLRWTGEGETFRMYLSLRNEGPLPVEVLSLDESLDYVDEFEGYSSVQPSAELVAPPEGGELGTAEFEASDYQAFESFRLGAGEARRVALEFTHGTCNLQGGDSKWNYFSMASFKVLGVTREFRLPWPMALVLEGKECRDARS